MERSNRSVSERVILAVATRTATDALELPQLYGSIDPDALDTLVHDLTDGYVHFKYAGCSVTVESTGAIRIDDHLTASGSAEEVSGNVSEGVSARLDDDRGAG